MQLLSWNHRSTVTHSSVDPLIGSDTDHENQTLYARDHKPPQDWVLNLVVVVVFIGNQIY